MFTRYFYIPLFSLTILILLPGTAVGASNNCQPFTLNDGSMQITVEVRGEEYPAVLTTSNIGSSISDSLARDLRLSRHIDPGLSVISDTGDEEDYYYAANVPIKLFGFETNADRMAIIDSNSRFITLSLRLFDDLIIQIDFPNSMLCFVTRDAMDLRQAQNIDLDSSAVSGTPAIRVTLNNEFDVWLNFSPEFDGGLRVDEFTASSIDLEPTTGSQSSLSPFHNAVLDALTFGPYELGNIPIQYPKDGVQDNLTRRQQTLTATNLQRDRQTRGRIGIEVLRHFVVTMDFELERMHVFAP